MAVQRVQLAPLAGVNLNAVEGESQQQPVVVKGFNLERAGGYHVQYGTTATPFVPFSGSVVSFGPDGGALFNERKLLLGDEITAFESSSVDGLEAVLVPRVGVVGNASLVGEDKYELGAYVRDTEGNVGDLPTVGMQFVASSGTVDVSGDDFVASGTYRFMGISFAPTELGLLAYDINTVDFSTSSVSALEIKTDGVLPQGYTYRLFFTEVNNDADSTFYAIDFERTSDGETELAFTLRDTVQGEGEFNNDIADDKLNPTSDALLGFDNNIVEPHKNRLWGVASRQPLTGPFAAKVGGETYFASHITKAGEFIASTSGTTLDALSTQVYGFVEFSKGIEWSTPIADQDVDANWYVPFFVRENQVEGGLKFSRVAGEQTARFYVGVNGVKQTFGDVVPTDQGALKFVDRASFLVGKNVAFIVDLGSTDADAVKIVVTDSAFAELYRFEAPLPSVWSTSFDSSSGLLQVCGLRGGSPFASVKFDVYETELFSDTSATSLVSIASGDEYVAGSSSWVSSGTGETWSLNTVYASARKASYQTNRTAAVTNSTGGFLLPTDLDESGSEVRFLDVLQNIPNQKTLLYTSIRRVNYGFFDNYIYLDFQNSVRITALKSTPAGLLVFGNNETYLVRGDPELPDSFEVQRAFATLGNDEGVTPGVLGGVVFPIWRGRIYSMALGMGDVDFGSGVQDISSDVFDPRDPFVQVVGDPSAREIIARTLAGRVLRFNPSFGGWYTDVFDEASGLGTLLPNVDPFGARYQLSDGFYVVSKQPTTASVRFENIDLGDKNLRKLWRRAYLFTNDDYAGTPTASFETSGSSSVMIGSAEGPGQFSFTFPSGVTATKLRSLEFNLVGASVGDSVEAPVEIEFTTRYKRR